MGNGGMTFSEKVMSVLRMLESTLIVPMIEVIG